MDGVFENLSHIHDKEQKILGGVSDCHEPVAQSALWRSDLWKDEGLPVLRELPNGCAIYCPSMDNSAAGEDLDLIPALESMFLDDDVIVKYDGIKHSPSKPRRQDSRLLTIPTRLIQPSAFSVCLRARGSVTPVTSVTSVDVKLRDEIKEIRAPRVARRHQRAHSANSVLDVDALHTANEETHSLPPSMSDSLNNDFGMTSDDSSHVALWRNELENSSKSRSLQCILALPEDPARRSAYASRSPLHLLSIEHDLHNFGLNADSVELPTVQQPALLMEDPPVKWKPSHRNVRRSQLQAYSQEKNRQANRRERYRHPEQAVQILVEWVNSNRKNMKPTKDEVSQLSYSTGLTEKQVFNWFLNRRHNRKR